MVAGYVEQINLLLLKERDARGPHEEAGPLARAYLAFGNAVDRIFGSSEMAEILADRKRGITPHSSGINEEQMRNYQSQILTAYQTHFQSAVDNHLAEDKQSCHQALALTFEGAAVSAINETLKKPSSELDPGLTPKPQLTRAFFSHVQDWGLQPPHEHYFGVQTYPAISLGGWIQAAGYPLIALYLKAFEELFAKAGAPEDGRLLQEQLQEVIENTEFVRQMRRTVPAGPDDPIGQEIDDINLIGGGLSLDDIGNAPYVTPSSKRDTDDKRSDRSQPETRTRRQQLADYFVTVVSETVQSVMHDITKQQTPAEQVPDAFQKRMTEALEKQGLTSAPRMIANALQSNESLREEFKGQGKQTQLIADSKRLGKLKERAEALYAPGKAEKITRERKKIENGQSVVSR